MGKSLHSIEEYYEQVKHEYNLDYSEFKLICSTPFSFIKNLANEGILRDFRLKYFGIFKVSPSKVKYYKKSLEESYNKGTISDSYYNKKINSIRDYEQNND